jgi:hypothetical protein
MGRTNAGRSRAQINRRRKLRRRQQIAALKATLTAPPAADAKKPA